ncbi:uncharacterized protein FOMMEDRAFT_25143 [Fomitiporia mediterranea MF3/22]|uniref:uncharacterized protein n=1 Tax=Fomitiporia mediterranea (strain MF3/22) TaxID=694068 RepID=UPI0004407AF6|nr:uncharacterized protein FOMMEDRAFT_25143 [Fomitiporia mediterranea MF3/22]EJD07899.1 hypothetical protein FOMMEDRAFT_25143 [Fomitiporia mediterranea MF3/22]
MTTDDRSLDERELKEALKMYGLEDKHSYTKDDVKKVYRKLALKCHPDKATTDPESNAKFRRVGRFREILDKYVDMRDTRTTLSSHDDDDVETLESRIRNRDAYMRALEDYIEELRRYGEWQEEQEKQRAHNRKQWEDFQRTKEEYRRRELQRQAWLQRKREEDRRQREAERQRFIAEAARARAKAEAEREEEERRRSKREAAQSRARADAERGDEWIYQTGTVITAVKYSIHADLSVIGVPGPRNPRPGVDFNYVHAPSSSTANRRSRRTRYLGEVMTNTADVIVNRASLQHLQG